MRISKKCPKETGGEPLEDAAKDDDITDRYDIDEKELPSNFDIEVVKAESNRRRFRKIASSKNYKKLWNN